MTTTLTAGVSNALKARKGASLYRVHCKGLATPARRYAVDGKRVTLARARAALAAGDPVVLSRIKVLKPGLFYGMGGAIEVLPEDLPLLVSRYESLTESAIFDPPVRVDHGMSVRDVIGWGGNLDVIEDLDPTVDERVPFLVSDLRITEPWALEAIERGTLDKRSSELGAYETNAGVLYPLIWYGLAFVDIPAVEGLGDLTPTPSAELRRLLGKPQSVIDVNDEGDKPVPPAPKKAAKAAAKAPAKKAGKADPTKPDDTDVDTTDVDDDTTTDDDTDDTSDDDTDVDDTEDEDDDEPVVGDPAPATGPDKGLAKRLRAVEGELATLRTAQADAKLRAYQEKGVVVKGNLRAAKALLHHDDPAVRAAAEKMLDVATAPVALGKRVGRSALGKDAGGDYITADMDAKEVGERWSALSREQRADVKFKAQYDEWREAHTRQ